MNNIRAICTAEGLACENIRPVSGGDINTSYIVHSGEKRYFLKVNDAALFPAMFKEEAEGLAVLQQQTLLKVPKVMSVGQLNDDQYLFLEWLDKTPPTGDFWECFGQGLAELHRLTNPAFGWHSSNYIGSLTQQNEPQDSWPMFYSTQRVMPLVKKLFDVNALSKAYVALAEKVCERLTEIFPEELPSLLHGDLWSGNSMPASVDDGNAVPAIFDPAVYYGNREMDLGISLLFGGFSNRFYEAYQSSFPLEAGWRKRLPLTQLYPLLVHAVLFGRGYVSQCQSILSNWGN